MTIVNAALLLATWVGSSLFRKWFDAVIWPKLADWWAGLTQQRLKKKISKLENRAEKADGMWLFSQTEWAMGSPDFPLKVAALE
jgi:hypothetical protein